MSRERRPLLTVTERIRRDTQATQRLASIGAEPQATGGPVALGAGLTRRGRDQLFGRDARRGDYIPVGGPTPEPTLFSPLFRAVRYFGAYSDDLPAFCISYFNWFTNFSSNINWRQPVWGQKVDKNDVIFIASYKAKILSDNLREVANLLEEDIQRLDHARLQLDNLLPENYEAPWTLDEETGLLWNNLDGYSVDVTEPHYV